VAIAIGVVATLVAACESGPTLDGYDAGLGRSPDGDLMLIGGPCSSEKVTALAIVEVGDDGAEDPVIRIELDRPTNAWDVVVPLDPLDLDQPGMVVALFDEDRYSLALDSTDGSFQVLTETVFLPDGSTDRFLVPFTPGLLGANEAFDFDVLIEDATTYSCARGDSKPWRDAFER
jgi:hypothetical protein